MKKYLKLQNFIMISAKIYDIIIDQITWQINNIYVPVRIIKLQLTNIVRIYSKYKSTRIYA